MKRTKFTTLFLIAICSLLAPACAKRDKIVEVADTDPEMLAAIAQARASLPQFWSVFSARQRGERNFALKVRIADKNGSEHFWLTDISKDAKGIMGTINNDPNIVGSVKLGDRIQIPEADISDWLYMRDDKMVGNRTLKPLFKKMPADEVARLKSIMAEP